jgi:hypothetical protein
MSNEDVIRAIPPPLVAIISHNESNVISLMNFNLILSLNSMTHKKEIKIDISPNKHINFKHVGLACKN